MASKKQNTYLKKANAEHEYSTQELIELKKCANDPKYFIKKYIKIQHPVLGMIPFSLYDYQEEIIDSFVNNQYNIIMSARQTGKSETSSAYLLWFAIFNKNKTILIASNKNSGAMEMIARIKFMYENLPFWLKPGIQDDAWSKHELGFDTNSRILSTATSETAGRGMSISLLFCDEFAFVKDNIQEEFWTSISPTLSTGGSCIISSTPNGDVNLFAQLWRGAQVDSNGFVPIYVAWDRPPGRDEEFKKKQIEKIGITKWLQEFECKFISSENLLIDTIVLNNLSNILLKLAPIEVINNIKFYEKIRPGATYLIGIDPASGKGGDFTVMNVFSFPELVQVAEYRTNTMSPTDTYKDMKLLLTGFEKIGATVYFTIENNSIGEALISLYMNDIEPPAQAEFISETGKDTLGMTTTSRSKLAACIQLKELIEKGKMTIKSNILLNELKSFVRAKSSYAAAIGSTDDCVASVLMVIRLLEEIVYFEQSAFDTLYSTDYNEWSEDKSWDGYSISEYDENDEGMPMII